MYKFKYETKFIFRFEYAESIKSNIYVIYLKCGVLL